MEKTKFCIASADDVAQLVPLINSAYRGEEAKMGWTHEADLIEGTKRIDEVSLLEMMQNPNASILKIMEQQKIIGCVYLEKKGSRMYLGMLTVSPRIQGKGTGKQLLRAAEDFAVEKNCRLIEMTVISARTELIDWYRRNGYHNTGITKPFPDDGRFGKTRRKIEFIVMEKKL
ncbi:MAG: GNAT family N-acetyltransferase [Flavisolibacter sp.]